MRKKIPKEIKFRIIKRYDRYKIQRFINTNSKFNCWKTYQEYDYSGSSDKVFTSLEKAEDCMLFWKKETIEEMRYKFSEWKIVHETGLTPIDFYIANKKDKKNKEENTLNFIEHFINREKDCSKLIDFSKDIDKIKIIIDKKIIEET